MKKTILVKKYLCLYALFVCLFTCLFFGINSITVKADNPITSYSVVGGQIKLPADDGFNGVRFPIFMNDEDYETYINGNLIEKTGAILCDASKVVGDLTLSTVGGVDFDTTDIWKESSESGYMEAGVFIYKIPATAVACTNNIACVGYYQLKNDDTIYYTDTIVRSAAQIAYSAYNDRNATETSKYKYETEEGDYSPFTSTQLTRILSYMPQYTITYMDGSTEIATDTVRYGYQADSSVSAGEKSGYNFSAWQLNGVDYDFSTAVTNNITLTASWEKIYVYGTGFNVVPAVSSFATVSEAQIAEGQDAGKWYKCITKESGEGSGSLTISATESAGLDANSMYLISITAETDGTQPAYYRETGAYNYGQSFYRMAGKSDVIFYAFTDANGEFTQVFNNTYWKNGSYVNFTGISAIKAAYDKGIQAYYYSNTQTRALEGIKDLGDGTGLLQVSKVVGEGSPVCNLYINATEEAGLLANTSYDVTVSVSVSNEAAGSFRLTDDSWIVNNGQTKNLTFTIETDVNGEFSQKFSTNYNSAVGTTTTINSISLVKTKISAYGTGVSLTLTPSSGITQSEVELDNGKWAKKLTKTSANSVSMRIDADTTAGLSANTNYIVTFDVETDATGRGLAFYETNNKFFLHEFSTSYTFTVKTDGVGAFSKSYTCYFTGSATYITFTAITITESAYGEDVDVAFTNTYSDGNGTGVSITQQTLTSGDNEGKAAICINKGGAGGPIKMTISGKKQANTTYNVTITVATDGARPSFYTTDNTYHWNSTTPSHTIQITTDANGDFSKTLNCYISSGGGMTYMTFTDITFAAVE